MKNNLIFLGALGIGFVITAKLLDGLTAIFITSLLACLFIHNATVNSNVNEEKRAHSQKNKKELSKRSY